MVETTFLEWDLCINNLEKRLFLAVVDMIDNFHQSNIAELLGSEYEDLLSHKCSTINKSSLNLPGPDSFERVFLSSNRNNRVIKSLSSIYNNGRLAKTGYISILPVDQSIEHGAGISFVKNPIYFDPENIIRLAIEGGCNAIVTTIGNFAIVSRKYAHKIPFIVKLNHNESLTYPEKFDQIQFGSVKNVWEMGAVAIGATIYFGSNESNRQIQEISEMFEEAHSLGLATILWCYPRNTLYKSKKGDYHSSVDLTGQCNHIGVTLQADIIKQKLPVYKKAFLDLGFSHTHSSIYEKLISPHPIDLCRYQVANAYMGHIAMLNSGGASSGADDLAVVIRTAIINKRAGGVGIIAGRKAFQRPLEDGIKLLNAIQNVYLDKSITIS